MAELTETAVISPPKRSDDVDVYVRHSETCTRRKASDCGCPLWLYDKKTQKRSSARTTSWDKANIEKQKILDSRDPLKKRLAELERKREYESVLLADAVMKFKEFKRSEGLAESSLSNYLSSVNQMKNFMHNRGVVELREISNELMNDWKAHHWKKVLRSRARRKVRTHIRMFFAFCSVNQRWLDRNDNPADALLTSKVKNRQQKLEEVVPAVPFYDDQYEAILEATAHYHMEPGRSGMKGRCTAQKLRAIIQLMRWSGLAIRDAANLERSRIDENGVLRIRRAKTGEWVTVPLPTWVVEELLALPIQSDGFFYDATRSRHPRSRTQPYAKGCMELFRTVKWPRPVQDGEGNPISPHPHMFRHSFAYWWLVTKHQDIRDLQILLGHSSLATTEGNYAHWMGDAAKALNDRVRSMHGPGPGKKEPVPVHEVPEHKIRVRHASTRFRSTISR